MTTNIDWQKQAPCKTTPIQQFFPKLQAGKNPDYTAPTICTPCQHRMECLQQGIKTGSEGYWGGIYLDKDSRAALRNAETIETTLTSEQKAMLNELITETLAETRKKLGISERKITKTIKMLKIIHQSNTTHQLIIKLTRQRQLNPIKHPAKLPPLDPKLIPYFQALEQGKTPQQAAKTGEKPQTLAYLRGKLIKETGFETTIQAALAYMDQY